MDINSAQPLILITVGAIFMPGVARRLAMPVAVAEIGFGIFLGNSGLGVIESTDFITFLSQVGFAFFMFTAGLEIDFRGVESAGLKPGLKMTLWSALSFVVAGIVALYFGWGPWVALAMGATSVGLLVAVMREAGELGTPFGKDLLNQGAVGESLTIILLSIAEIQHRAHGEIGEILRGAGSMVGLALAAAVTVILLRTAVWWYPNAFGRLTAHDDPAELGVRVGFGMMFAFVGLSLLAHVEPFLGAFLAGAMLAYVIRDKGALEHKLATMAYGFFVPVFFIAVGVRFDLSVSTLFDNAGMAITIILAMFAAKFIPSLSMLSQGHSFAKVVAGSCLLAAPLTLVIAIVEVGMKGGAIDSVVGGVVIVAGILGSLINTILARMLFKREPPPEGVVVAASGH